MKKNKSVKTTNRSCPRTHESIREMRVISGLSLRGLSKKSGIDFTALSRIENGKLGVTWDKMCKLAEALNCSAVPMMLCRRNYFIGTFHEGKRCACPVNQENIPYCVVEYFRGN